MESYEIERRFLICMPNCEFLQKNCKEQREITQAYLKDHSRIRSIKKGNETVYIKTVKTRISDIKRLEREWEITKTEFLNDLKEKQDGTNEIVKTRFVYEFGGLDFEIDIFPFWQNQAILEIELKSEEQSFVLPPFVKVIKEVTNDRRYNNFSLAKTVINEEV